MYSKCPNTGRPVCQTGRKYVRISNISDVRLVPICPVIGRLLYLKRPITGHLCPDFRHKPVWNRFQTGLEQVLVLVSAIRRPVGSNGTGRPITGGWNWNEPDNPKSGQYCPDFRRYLKSGRFNNRTSLQKFKNRTSGFRTFTVCICAYKIGQDLGYSE